MLKLSDLKSIVSILENNKIKYYVFGGMALEGLRGKITREHSDLDLFIVDKDLKKLCEVMGLDKYTYIKRENMFFFEHKKIKIGVLILTIDKEKYIANGNKTLEIYPAEIFSKKNSGKIGEIIFSVAPNEVLVFESQYSNYAEDKEFGSKLKHNASLYKKIQFKKLRDSRE